MRSSTSAQQRAARYMLGIHALIYVTIHVLPEGLRPLDRGKNLSVVVDGRNVTRG
jgi:hypothetical protein